LAKLNLSVGGRYFGRFLPMHPMNPAGWDPQWEKQPFLSQEEVAFWIDRRNTSFITPKKMHPIQGADPSFGYLGSGGEKPPGDSPTRQRNAVSSPFAISLLNLIKPLACRGLR
jgi:hypothetical protein